MAGLSVIFATMGVGPLACLTAGHVGRHRLDQTHKSGTLNVARRYLPGGFDQSIDMLTRDIARIESPSHTGHLHENPGAC